MSSSRSRSRSTDTSRLGVQAAKAASTVKRYHTERKEALCREVDPKRFDKDPKDFVYTKDSCRSKSSPQKREGGKTVRKMSSRDKAEIERLEHIMATQYPIPTNGSRRMPSVETKASHEIVMGYTAMMLMPFYRKEVDPEKRFLNIVKAWKIPDTKPPPRYRVMSNVLMILKGLSAPEDREKVVRLGPDAATA